MTLIGKKTSLWSKKKNTWNEIIVKFCGTLIIFFMSVMSVSVFNADLNLCVLFSTACTLILEFYCMCTKLIVKPPDQRRRQVEVSLYSKWYFLRPEVGVLAKSFKLTFNRPFYFMRKNYHLYKKTINLWLRLCYDVRKKGFLDKISVCRRYFYRLRSV